MAKGIISIMKRASVVCGECDTYEVVLDKGWRETEGELRNRGWSRIGGKTWLCPVCMARRRINKKVSYKMFRGLFIRDGKKFVKSRDGNIYPVANIDERR